MKSVALYLGFFFFLYLMYQQFHWQVSGENFYSNHLLFERLYNEIAKNSDEIAEKIVGLFGKDAINISEQLSAFKAINDKSIDLDESTFRDYVEKALVVESDFQKYLTNLKNELENDKKLTLGFDDMLMGHVSDSENRCYLLKQSI